MSTALAMLITLPPKKFYVGNVFLFNSKPTLSVEDPLDWVSDHWSQRQDVRGQMRGFLQDEQGSLHWGEKSHFKVISLSNTHSHFLTHSEHNSGKILPILPGNQDTRAFGPFLCWAHIYSLKMQVLHFSGWCWLISVDGVGRSPLEKQMTVLVKKSWRGLSLTTLPWYDKMSRESYAAACYFPVTFNKTYPLLAHKTMLVSKIFQPWFGMGKGRATIGLSLWALSAS